MGIFFFFSSLYDFLSILNNVLWDVKIFCSQNNLIGALIRFKLSGGGLIQRRIQYPEKEKVQRRRIKFNLFLIECIAFYWLLSFQAMNSSSFIPF